MNKKNDKNKNLTIEESFRAIDKIIENMDSDKCTIEKSLELYESGVKLLNDVSKKVDKIEKELKVLNK